MKTNNLILSQAIAAILITSISLPVFSRTPTDAQLEARATRSAANNDSLMLDLQPTAPLNMDEVIVGQVVRSVNGPALPSAPEQQVRQGPIGVGGQTVAPREEVPDDIGSLEPAPNGPGCDVTPASAVTGARCRGNLFRTTTFFC